MRHFLRFYIQRIKASLMQFMEYRMSMFMAILGTYGYTGMMLMFISVLFAQTNELGGWNKAEILLLFGLGQSILYIAWSFFGVVFWGVFSETVIGGELDLFLTKPVNSLFNVIMSEFTLVETLPSFALGIGIIVYAAGNISLQLSLILIPVMLSLFFGLIIATAGFTAISMLSFWLTDTRDILNMQGAVLNFNQYPVEIFPKLVKYLFVSAVPVSLIAYPAAKMLLEQRLNIYFAIQPFIALFMLLLVKILWSRGLKRYSSASS